MDLGLYFRVIWRFRFVVLAGLIFAVLLTFLSMARIEFKNGVHVSYRKPETWGSTATLMLTQNGFPVGRSNFTGSPYVNTAVIYANLATSDPVRQIMAKRGPIEGEVAANAVSPPNNPTYLLPFVQITATAVDPRRAVALAQRASWALRTYLQLKQQQSATPEKRRIILDEVVSPKAAVLFAGRKKTLPITIFLAVVVATLALAFILENLRPRIRRVSEDEEPRSAEVAGRKSA